jgi:trimeric autotransporter adhesin
VKSLRVLVAALIGVVGAVIGPMPQALAYGTVVTPTWAANDVVRTIVNVNGITYLGGRFTSLIGPDSATVPRAHLAALDANGDPLPWDPGASGSVTKMAVSGSTLYVGGLFRTIDGHSQPRLAAFDLTTGDFETSWRPRPNGTVSTMSPDPTTDSLFIGGGFTAVSGVPRDKLAAVALDTGAVMTAFDPGLRRPGVSGDTAVRGVVAVGGRLIAVGEFVPHIQSFDPLTGALQPWLDHAPYRFQTVDSDGTNVYAGSGNGGGHINAFRLSDGARLWDVHGDGNVQTIAVGPDGLIYVGGHYCNIDDVYQEFLTVWTPDGQLQSYALDFTPDCYGGIWAIDPQSDTLYLGGAFTRIQGIQQRRFAELKT